MITFGRQLILASGSPRRKEIMDAMGLSYCVDVSDADESFMGEPRETVCTLSRLKAEAVAPRHTDAVIVAADTIVYGKQTILGKPHSAEEAKAMLRMLSGKWHEVYTGITLLDTVNGRMLNDADVTRVHFSELSDQDINAYVATGEPFGKAGAYAIQGMGGMLIDRIEGSYSNVVGLPMALLRRMLLDMNRNELSEKKG